MDNNFSFETGDEEASPFLTGMAMTYITCHLGCQEEELRKIYVIPLLLAMSIFWPPEGKSTRALLLSSHQRRVSQMDMFLEKSKS
jgi:hypothetical protein